MPDISISNKDEDKSVFGVISTVEDPIVGWRSMVIWFKDKEGEGIQGFINSLGEGYMGDRQKWKFRVVII